MRAVRSSLLSLRSDESRLRLFFDRMHLTALTVLTITLIVGVAITRIEVSARQEFTQIIVFFTATAVGLIALALSGRMWLAPKQDRSFITIGALVLGGVVTYLTGGSVSYFAMLPLLICGLDAPFHTGSRVWVVAVFAGLVLSAPLYYDFSYWYLRLTIFGWICIATLTNYSAGVVKVLGRKRTEARELAALARASKLATTLDVEAILAGTVSLVTELLDPHGCVLYLATEGATGLVPSYKYLDPRVHTPERIAAIMASVAVWGRGLIGTTAKDQMPRISLDISVDPLTVPIPGTGFHPETYLLIPLVFDGTTLGVLRVSREGANQYTEDDLTLAAIFANQAAVAIANARLYEKARVAEREARVSEHRYVRLTRNAGEVIMHIDCADRRVTFVNEAVEQILGFSLADFTDQPDLVVRSIDDLSAAALDLACTRLAEGDESVRDVVLTWTSKDGRTVILDHVMIPIRDPEGKLTGIETIARDITERYRLESAIRELTFTDQLTGIANRAFFEQELKRLSTSRSLPLTVIMADVNGLKLTNDAFGHAAGDRLLAKAARLMSSALRRSDVLCRWGGDEFAMLLPRVDEAGAEEILSRIRMAVSQSLPDPIPVSIAFGMCTKYGPGGDLQPAISEAEERMYHGKLFEAKRTQSVLIESLQRVLWQKTDETREHTRRVQALCSDLATDLGLDGGQMDDLALFAMLHDVGKVAAGSEIFQKEGSLSTSDWIAVKRHPEIGYRIASANHRLMPIADLILSHHEHWDGSGYPRGLAAEQIPFLARILAVVDAYDVMIAGKPYRPARTHEEAIREIIACSGRQFDPSVVASFIGRMRMTGMAMRAIAGDPCA